jgi:uncharacterized protein (TIGR02391 family)
VKPLLYNIPLTRIRQTDAGEERVELKVMIDSQKIFFPVDADVDDGGLIEESRPGGRARRLELSHVVSYRSPHGGGRLDHAEADWKVVTAPRLRPAIRRVTIDEMHGDISAVAGALYADGHYTSAVFEAFRTVETRVKQLSGVEQSGKKLMSQVFGGTTPRLDITTTTGQNAVDEREGFNQLFMGAAQGLRNPRGHETPSLDTAEEALEYLAIASMLMRRLDRAEERLNNS